MDWITLVLEKAGIVTYWPAIVALGGTIGFLTGLFGVGGGFLLTPCMRYILGIPFPIAVGSGMIPFCVTGSFSAYKHYHRNNVDIRMGSLMAVGAMGGALTGARVLRFLKEQAGYVAVFGNEIKLLELVMPMLFILLMAGVGISILRETKKSKDMGDDEPVTGIALKLRKLHIPPMIAFPRSNIEALSLWVPLVVSFAIGTLTGLLGVGGGFIMFPLLVYVIGLPTSVAVGTSAFQIVFATAAGSVRHYLYGNVEFKIVFCMIAGSLIGAQLGVYASQFIDSRKTRRYFSFVLGIGVMVLLYGLYRTLSGAPAPGAG